MDGIDRNAIEWHVHAHLTNWRTLLATQSVEDGRQRLREVLSQGRSE